MLSALHQGFEDESGAMTWTSEKPTVPGWYWHRQHDAVNGVRFVRICEIERVGNTLFVLGLQPGRFVLENASGAWAGPLEPPKEQP